MLNRRKGDAQNRTGMSAHLGEHSPRLKIINAHVPFKANAGIIDSRAAASDCESPSLRTEGDGVRHPARTIQRLEPLASARVPDDHVAIRKPGGYARSVARYRN